MASTATKIFSHCSRWFSKCSIISPSPRKACVFSQVKPFFRACGVFCNNSVTENGSHDRETENFSRKTRVRNYALLFGLPFAVLVSTAFSIPIAFCGNEDDTPVKATTTSASFIFSRARKAEKRKAQTERARGEICKRQLFEEDTENLTPPAVLIEPRILRENPPQRRIEDLVSENMRLQLRCQTLHVVYFLNCPISHFSLFTLVFHRKRRCNFQQSRVHFAGWIQNS